MPTKYAELFAQLAAPFAAKDVKDFTKSGRKFRYSSARVYANRLDDVLGPENWWNAVRHGSDNSITYSLTIRLPDGSTVTKEDAGGAAGMADGGDDDKSAVSDGLKRAASLFGVGRFLYGDGVPAFVYETLGIAPRGHGEASPEPDREGYRTRTVAEEPRREEPRQADPAQERKPYDGPQNAPRTGKALFAFCKEQEEKHEVGVLKYLTGWAKLQDFGARMVDWNETEVSLAYAEALRKLDFVRRGNEGSPDNEPAY